MDASFEEREAIHYFKQCNTICSSWSMKNRPTSDFLLREEPAAYSSFTDPIHVIPDSLTGEPLQEMLDRSFESPHLFPDKHTYYLMDISSNKETPYNTLMFQLHEAPMKSTETTKEVVDRFFESIGSSYELSTTLGKMLGYKQCIPHVAGELFFVPDKGASKQPASWYALHLVTQYVCDAKEKQVQLYANKFPILTLKTTKNSFQKQLERTANMYYIKLKWTENQAQQFHFVRRREESENSVHKYLQNNPYPLPRFTYWDYLNVFIHYRAQQLLLKVLGVENPYLEEIRKLIKLPLY